MKRLVQLMGCVALCLHLGAAEPDGGWRNLGKLERSNVYTVLLRDKICQSGKIGKVEADKLTLGSGITAARSEVLFVGEGLSPHEILYSSRSSWDEVKQVHTAPLESLTIRLKSGKSLNGSELITSDSDLTIKRYGRLLTISKHDIGRVDYVRFKQVSEGHRYFAQEAAGLQFLDPKALQYLLRIDALISVRIYDSTLPEDNSPLVCVGDRSKN